MENVAASINYAEVRAALAISDPAISSFLDLETGKVVKIIEGDTSPEQVELSQLVMDSYGDRFRYIPGGNAGADDAAVQAWAENEGLA